MAIIASGTNVSRASYPLINTARAAPANDEIPAAGSTPIAKKMPATAPIAIIGKIYPAPAAI